MINRIGTVRTSINGTTHPEWPQFVHSCNKTTKVPTKVIFTLRTQCKQRKQRCQALTYDRILRPPGCRRGRSSPPPGLSMVSAFFVFDSNKYGDRCLAPLFWHPPNMSNENRKRRHHNHWYVRSNPAHRQSHSPATGDQAESGALLKTTILGVFAWMISCFIFSGVSGRLRR